MGVIDRIAQTTAGMRTMLETGSMQCKQCAQTNARCSLFSGWGRKKGQIAPVKIDYEQKYNDLKGYCEKNTKTLEDNLKASREYGNQLSGQFQGMREEIHSLTTELSNCQKQLEARKGPYEVELQHQKTIGWCTAAIQSETEAIQSETAAVRSETAARWSATEK
eukprot:2945177-Rhodomonas_salina.1